MDLSFMFTIVKNHICSLNVTLKKKLLFSFHYLFHFASDVADDVMETFTCSCGDTCSCVSDSGLRVVEQVRAEGTANHPH